MLALGCSNDHNMLGNVAFTVIPWGVWPGLIFTPKLFAKLQCCHVRPPIMALAECIAFAFVLCYLENTPSHINKDRELKQRGMSMRTLQNNRLNYRIQSLHVGMQSPDSSVTNNKRNVGICWAKNLTGFKLDETYANIMQHSPTWCTNEHNMLCPTCWHNMLRSFARALRALQSQRDANIYSVINGRSNLCKLLLELKNSVPIA